MNGRYRVACLVSHPIQYQAPLFRYLAPARNRSYGFLSERSLGARLSRCGLWREREMGRAAARRLPARLFALRWLWERASFWWPWTFGLRARLRRGRFDALWVHGYAYCACLAGIAAAKSLGISVMLRGESNLLSETDDALKLGVKRIAIPALLRTIDAMLAIGRLNREYYLHYGVGADRIFAMPYAVDNEFFEVLPSARARNAKRCVST